MSEAVWGPALGLAATVIFGWLLVSGFRTGTMEFPQPALTMSGRRRDQPIRFWLTASLVAFLTIVSAAGTVWVALDG